MFIVFYIGFIILVALPVFAVLIKIFLSINEKKKLIHKIIPTEVLRIYPKVACGRHVHWKKTTIFFDEVTCLECNKFKLRDFKNV